MSAIAHQLAQQVGIETTPVEALPSELQAQIQRAAPQASVMAHPPTVAALGELVACAQANRWPILPVGAGSKLHWGPPGRAAIAVSLAQLNRVIDHAAGDLTVTAEAGVRLADLQQQLGRSRQGLAIAPHYADRATLGGIVATADSGSSRQRYGGVRDMLIGISFVRADGQLAKAGGRVVKNVAGYDLMKLLTGAYGTLGLITQVTFRLYPLPDTSETLVLTGDAAAIATVLGQIRQSSLSPVALDVVSQTWVSALGLGQGMGLLVRLQSMPVSVAQQSAQVLALAAAAGLTWDRLEQDADASLWQRLQEKWDDSAAPAAIACKIGVLPAQAVTTLDALQQQWPTGLGLIHAGSGLGWLGGTADSITATGIAQVRSLCTAQGGFLTLLSAPPSWTALNRWGYGGNALPQMQAIKAQFDPHHLLNPGRFVGGL
jgi:glycolate oxidase FAD binding subunit